MYVVYNCDARFIVVAACNRVPRFASDAAMERMARKRNTVDIDGKTIFVEIYGTRYHGIIFQLWYFSLVSMRGAVTKHPNRF